MNSYITHINLNSNLFIIFHCVGNENKTAIPITLPANHFTRKVFTLQYEKTMKPLILPDYVCTKIGRKRKALINHYTIIIMQYCIHTYLYNVMLSQKTVAKLRMASASQKNTKRLLVSQWRIQRRKATRFTKQSQARYLPEEFEQT